MATKATRKVAKSVSKNVKAARKVLATPANAVVNTLAKKAAKADTNKKASVKRVFTDLPQNGKIKIIAEGNPYRDDSAKAKFFAMFKNGMTVAAALEKGIPRDRIVWGVRMGHMKVG